MPCDVLHCITFLCLSAMVTVDTVDAPLPHRIFASAYGRYGVHVFVEYKSHKVSKVVADCFELDEKGAERRRWEATLPYVPARALVSDSGHVVCLDDYARPGYEHALVILDEKGAVRADYGLDDILSPQEVRDHVMTSVSGRHWTYGAAFTWPSQNLVIRMPWGRVLTIDLASGKFVAP